MTNDKILYEHINIEKEGVKKFNPEIFDIPQYILINLKYELFYWQQEALENFLYYQNPQSKLLKTPTHLMFNMATGTGKTLIMASLILYYYKQGYNHFIFFVNQNNIIDKTENNFINKYHNKYLYTDPIVIDNKTINIKKVETFSDFPNDIEIKFTTIQKLYNDIHLPKENQTTLEDLYRRDIVMLADEAHHLNTDTKNKYKLEEEIEPVEITSRASEEEIERKGWEHTVINLLLNKNGKDINNKNVLLEFTATIPSNQEIAEKYKNKIIYKFGLKEFLSAGYTKEINLISSTLEKKERILQALLFHWYRHKLALKHNIPNLKPVILFRSKTIEESKKDFSDFLEWTENINVDDFNFLKSIFNKLQSSKNEDVNEQGKSRTEQVLNFIKKNNISYSEIVNFIKNNFNKWNVIITNSETNKTKTEITDEETEQLLNSLEDKNNHIRAIFTVDRLTEGWDVLNLFDIVRLYQEQPIGGSTKKTPESTIKEKQLIGRGVRYYPFEYQDKPKNKRKFDDNVNHELRALEELYYYTYDEGSRYVSHLKAELRKDGYINDNKIIKIFKLKECFKNTYFYKNTKVWYNEREKLTNNNAQKIIEVLKNNTFNYKIMGLEVIEEEVVFDIHDDQQIQIVQNIGIKTIPIKFKDIEKHIFRKAINIKAKQYNSIFQFINLKNLLNIESIEDLQKSDLLGDFIINIITDQYTNYDEIDGNYKLDISISFLSNIISKIEANIEQFKGSDFKSGNFEDFFDKPKEKIVDKDKINDAIANNNWYVLDSFVGTDEETALVEFIKNTFNNLKSKYNEIYLLRNEEVYKIYDFKKGRAFQPDFLLFLKQENENILYYQIFIEPKGNIFIGADGTFKSGKEGWKEEFLEEITKYGFNNPEIIPYHIIGLPFFNKDHNKNFEDKYKKLY